MKNSQLETYPAFERSKFDETIELIQTTNGREISYDGWKLPATEPKKEDCGKWSFNGCLNVDAHKHSEFKGKIFVKTFQKSCFRASCELCVRKWAGREADKAKKRIEKYASLSKKPPKHIVVSVPFWHYHLDYKEQKRIAYRISKEVGVLGGAMIFHPFRFNKESREWYYSPHFHIVGFGWIKDTKELYNKEGWIVKNKGVREYVFGTVHYLLSHCGIKKRNHSLVWFGDLSYSKLKMEKEPETNVCPVCNAKLRPIYYYGLLRAPPPETECEIFVDPEGWHVLENKPRPLKPITKEELEKKRVARDLYYANNGVCLN